MSYESEISELQEALNGLDNALIEAEEAAHQVRRLAYSSQDPEIKRVVAGQMDYYTIPTLKSFQENESQPGSVASMKQFLGQDI